MGEKLLFWFAFVTGQLRPFPPEFESENANKSIRTNYTPRHFCVEGFETADILWQAYWTLYSGYDIISSNSKWTYYLHP